MSFSTFPQSTFISFLPKSNALQLELFGRITSAWQSRVAHVKPIPRTQPAGFLQTTRRLLAVHVPDTGSARALVPAD